MFLTGFADEAGADFSTQIKATRELGWKYIESRAIGKGKNLATISEAEFESVQQQLHESGIRINCFGSSVANWNKDPRDPQAFQASCDELLAALPRMEKLGIKMIRGMSFAMVKDAEPDAPELESRIYYMVNELVRMCADHGVIYGHENCMNYGGLSHVHTLKLLDHIHGNNFKLIYDTGNPCFNYRYLGSAPYPLQSSWEFYRNVREFIAYVHIKDATAIPQDDWTKGAKECVYTWPGEGNGDVRAIVKDLLARGYEGGFSMEPHVAIVFHNGESPDEKASIAYAKYVEYGRRFEQLLRDCGWKF